MLSAHAATAKKDLMSGTFIKEWGALKMLLAKPHRSLLAQEILGSLEKREQRL